MFKTVFTSNYTIGSSAYEEISKISKVYGKKVVMIGGKIALSKASEKIKEAIKTSEIEIIEILWYGGEASYENASMLSKEESVKKSDIIFAVGGGKALDTCKLLADKIKKPIFTFPTIAATCAAMTSICAVYYPDGVFREPYFRKSPAEHSFIDTDIILNAPIKYIWAGMGDTLAKAYEPEFSSRGESLNFSNSLGVILSKMCKEPIFNYGTKALRDCKNKILSNSVEEVVLSIIAATGTVSNSLEMQYNSCVAHALCYGFTVFPKVEEIHLHGELVAYGVLVETMIDNNLMELNKLINFYKNLGLPISYKEFEISKEELELVLDKACTTVDIEKSYIPINKEVLRKAIFRLEYFLTKEFSEKL